MQNDPCLQRSKRHLEKVRNFLYHLTTYVFVSALLVILDLRDGTSGGAVFGLDWAYWVMLFWGVGVAGHAIAAFFGEDRVEARYEREQNEARLEHEPDEERLVHH